MSAAQARAGAYLSAEEALKLAFPGAERVEKRNFVLTSAQKQRVEELSKAPLPSQIVAVNIGMRGSEPIGYAWIDVHTVRTVQQGLMVVITPDGRVESVRVLAFYEPPEYLPNDRFRTQYAGRPLDDDLQLGHGIQAVSGATLSSVATTRAVRRSLALYQVLVAEAAPRAPKPDVAGEGAGTAAGPATGGAPEPAGTPAAP